MAGSYNFINHFFAISQEIVAFQPNPKNSLVKVHPDLIGSDGALGFLQRVSIACYAQRCISYSKSVRLSVRLSVCLSHAGTESKRLKLRSWGLHWRIAP